MIMDRSCMAYAKTFAIAIMTGASGFDLAFSVA